MIFTHKDVFLPRQTEKALKFCFEYEGGFLSRQTFSFEHEAGFLPRQIRKMLKNRFLNMKTTFKPHLHVNIKHVTPPTYSFSKWIFGRGGGFLPRQTRLNGCRQ